LYRQVIPYFAGFLHFFYQKTLINKAYLQKIKPIL
jgi:hypothetical protein